MHKQMRRIILLPVLIIAMMACKNSRAPENTATVAQLDSFAVKLKQLNLDVHSQEDVIAFFQLSGADFMPGIVNDPMLNEKYLGNDVMAAANSGVYLADGLYQLAYNQFNDGYLSLQAAKNITIKLGMGEAFDDLVIDRYSANEYNSDSILAKLDSALVKTNSLMKEQDRMRIYTGLFGGNYVEKLYLQLSMIFEYNVDLPDESKLLILRQVMLSTAEFLKALPKVIELIEMNQKDTDPGIILGKLKEIETLRLQLKFADEPGKLTPPMIFENQTLLDIYAKVKETRQLIISVPEGK